MRKAPTQGPLILGVGPLSQQIMINARKLNNRGMRSGILVQTLYGDIHF